MQSRIGMNMFYVLIIHSLFNRLETDTRRKKRRGLKKKVCSCCEVFFVVIRIRLILLDMFLARVNQKEKSHPDLTNRHIHRKMNREKKKTKLSVYSILIKSL